MQVEWMHEGEEEHRIYYMGTLPGLMGTMYYGGKKESLH